MAARTMGCEDAKRRSAVCVLVLLFCSVSFVRSHSRSLQADHRDVIEVSYFPNSQHNFGFRGQLSEAELHQQELDVLQLKNEIDGLNPAFHDSGDVAQNWNILQHGHPNDLPQFRRRRDITPLSVTEDVLENTNGILIDLRTKFSDSAGRIFAVNSTSSHEEMFEVTPSGELRLRDGFHLDYEDESMRTISFVVHATSSTDSTDVYEISVTLTVTNVDEPPVFETQPQPYLATVRSDTGSGYVFITLVAKDPEGEPVQYEKRGVSPNTYKNRIELRTVTRNGVRQCELVTVGSGRFVEGDTFSVTVTARDRSTGGQLATTTVSVLVGVRPPQFFQSNYQGAMPEKNQVDQTVYKLGTSSELKVEWKTFQDGPVRLSLREETTDTQKFNIRPERPVTNEAYIVCKEELDYETANPKIRALTVTAVQTVGLIELSTNIPLTVEIIDINDNRPVFEQSQYLKTVPENIALGNSVLEVIAKDKDTGMNAEIVYSLLDTDDFEIVTEPPFGNPPTYKGVIKSKRPLDYDRIEGPYYLFKVKATDRGALPQTSTSNIRVTVTNVNDEAPQFLNQPGEEYSVQENAGPGQFITQILATDGDGDKVTYSFSNRLQTDQKFRIDSNTGQLTLDQSISDNDDRFTLTILAKDDGSCCPGVSSKDNQTTIYVQVYGLNEQRPDFRSCSQYNPSVDENSPTGTSVILVLAEDNDRGPNGVVSYTLTQSQDVFAIDSSTGLITVRTEIDRETTAFKQVTVKATDGGNPAEESYCSFRVTINDVNDNAPRFDKNRYVGNITRSVPINVPFLFVRAYDDDVGTNARIIYSLPNDAEGKFSIIPENGFISLAQALQQGDVGQSFSLTAMAKDEGSPFPLNATVSVRVNVEEGSTKPPSWDKDYNQLTETVAETVAAGTVIIPDMVCDSNIANKKVEFQLVKEDGTTGSKTEFFEITPNGTSVTVKATGKFDYTKRTEHTVHIRCLSFGAAALLNETNPKVLLEDTNNQIPEFQGLDDKGRYAASVQENKPAGTIVGTVEASDKDTNPSYNEITFSITEGGENFTIEQGTKRNTAIVKTLRPFDREEKKDYFVTILATDGAPSSLPGMASGQHNEATVYMNVKISDVNDNAPKFQYTQYNVTVPESTYINDLIYPAITVDDADDTDRGRHTYRIISGNTNDPAFGIRNGLGNLFPRRKLDYEGADKHFTLVVEASDGRAAATTTVNVTVEDENDNSPVFGKTVYLVTDVVENDNNVPRLLTTMTATDADVERPNDIRYSLEGSSFDVRNFFSINDRSGQLSIIAPLDRDPPNGRPNYQFTVKAADEALDPNFGYATVSVTPLDLNDNRPEFVTDPLEASVPENSQNGTSVVRLEARDNDYGVNGTVDISIASIVDGANVARPDYFRIDSDRIVKTNTARENLDRESEDKYYLTIELKDRGLPGFVQENSGVLTVTLSDKNDQPPIFQQKIYTTEMTENLQSGEVIRVIAKDNDIGENAKISYVLDGPEGSRFFSVTAVNNEGSIQIGTPVDYEDPTQRFFNLTVKAQDNAGHEDTCYVEIYVLDFNDNAPDIQPKTMTGNVSEAASPGTMIATFTATDDDVSEINKEFEFSISRTSDPRRHFSIGSKSGQVKVRRKLDRETEAVHVLTILAIDKGSPPLTGTASLTVVVEDVNDNYPTFKEDYNPHIMENKDQMSKVVQVVLGKDPDAPPYGAPFGFELGPCPSECKNFKFESSEGAAGGNGSATITVSTNKPFDREDKKNYFIPIVMWDMRGISSRESMTGTNTLTITIADENDNTMGPGIQNIFVYNYKGMFGPVDIGRVYVEDPDDWDLPDKTFNYTGPVWMNSYFKVDYNTGMVTMSKGVPSNARGKPYTFTVKVYDKHWKKEVTSTVKVTVEELSEEAVRNSGATRFTGTSAEAFISIPKVNPNNKTPQKSAFEKFHEKLADKLDTDKENVQIISVQDVEGGYTDVRYAVHGSPYYPPSQTDSIVVMNKEEFERDLKLDIDEVPIDACSEEVFEGGCYNYMDITENPALVNSNGTSFVGVEVFIRAMEGCRALDFPEPNECSGDYCYHGGTCVKNDFGVLSCINCPKGFEGPRCQQLRHSFDGRSYAMYPMLEQCEDSETSIEFITEQENGMLFYNGPMTDPGPDKPQDYISLELAGGMPVLYIDHGSGSVPLNLDGKNQAGQQVMDRLSDGQWHKIDIIRKGKLVEMIVDDCKIAAESGSESTPPDTTPCRVTATTRGENSFLNVATLLYVGGRAPKHSFPQSSAVRGSGFSGCVRNLVHNSKYYDLHYKETRGVPSGANGCPREDELCAAQNCGEHGICTATFIPARASCVCRPGWRVSGSECSQNTLVRDLKSSSFIKWQLKNDVQLLNYQLEIQVMYRTWDTDGILFTTSTPDNTKRVTMELKDGQLQVLYNLDNQDNILILSNTNASDGFWHVARFKRVMYLATLTLDHGEGRNHASRRQSQGNVYMTLTSSSPVYGGASVTNPSGAQVLDRDLENTCIQDIRLNGDYLPIKSSENVLAKAATFVKDQQVVDGCSRPNGCVPYPNCDANEVCVPLWGRHECRCAPWYHETPSGQCQSDCEPDNPCFMDMPCSVENGSLVCTCLEPWYGTLCNLYPTQKEEPVVGIADTTIVAIVVSILLVIILMLLAFFLVTYYKRKKSREDFDKFVVEEDADYDIRENVVFYDEEGAGEEDQNAFDLAKLPTPTSEIMKPPVEMVPRSRELPRGRRVPDDRPDVGDVLHDRLHDANGDPEAPPHDTLIAFNEEGAGSDAGSLSSLGSSSSDASQDYDYLNDWGPKFAKLADMYGAGQD